MSWSFSRQIKLADLASEDLTEEERGNIERGNLPGLDQAEKALAVALDFIRSGVLGSPDKTYSVSLSGHGNEGHEPMQNWSNDMVYIIISQMTPPTP